MKPRAALLLIALGCAAAAARAAPLNLDTPIRLTEAEYRNLEQQVCLAPYGRKAAKIKAYAFAASPGAAGKLALGARTSAYVECASHGDFMHQPMRYIDECDLVDGTWDCSPPQLELQVNIHERSVKLRPWGDLTPEQSAQLLQDISNRGRFQGESLDQAIGNSCDISRTKDPEVIELGCSAAMSISYWCPQAQLTGCPRVLYLNFDEPAYKRR